MLNLDFIVLIQALLHHVLQRLDGNGQLAAVILLKNKFVLSLPVPEQHHHTVYPEQKKQRRQHDQQSSHGAVLGSECFYSQADQIHIEKHLRHNRPAGSQQKETGNRHKNPV